MEIVLQQFNINDAINSQWQSNNAKNEIIERDREAALEIATKAIKSQFERELDTYLEGNIKNSLLQLIVPPQKLDIFAIYAVFVHENTDFMISRDTQHWTIKSNYGTITTTPDLLQKTLLLELGRIKNEILNQ